MRTLLLNPPSFEKFDGGASSRWPASREIESYWYPVWLCYPAGLIPDSKVVDAPPHGVSIEQTVAMAKDFEFLVLFTSTPGFAVDVEMAEMMKDANPKLKIAFVGPPVTIEPETVLKASSAIDFVVRREFDHQVADFAKGVPVADLPGASFRKNGRFVHNPEGPPIEDLDSLPWVTKIYKRDLDFTRYNVPFIKNPFLAFYTSRGCPAMCTFCLWPQTHSGHRWRKRSGADVANELRWAIDNFPDCAKSSSTTTRSTTRRRAPSNCAPYQAAQLHLVLHLARHHRLRDAEGHEGSRLPAVDRGLRIRRPPDSQEHQEGRHRGHGATLHQRLQEAGPGRARRFHRGPARGNAREHPAAPSTSPNAWIARPCRFPSLILTPAPSSTITSATTT